MTVREWCSCRLLLSEHVSFCAYRGSLIDGGEFKKPSVRASRALLDLFLEQFILSRGQRVSLKILAEISGETRASHKIIIVICCNLRMCEPNIVKRSTRRDSIRIQSHFSCFSTSVCLHFAASWPLTIFRRRCRRSARLLQEQFSQRLNKWYKFRRIRVHVHKVEHFAVGRLLVYCDCGHRQPLGYLDCLLRLPQEWYEAREERSRAEQSCAAHSARGWK